jgi:3-methyladenine DNA glycosylase Mpg
LPEGAASGRSVETEAYVAGDAAGHAFKEMTPRIHSLSLEPGASLCLSRLEGDGGQAQEAAVVWR